MADDEFDERVAVSKQGVNVGDMGLGCWQNPAMSQLVSDFKSFTTRIIF